MTEERGREWPLHATLAAMFEGMAKLFMAAAKGPG